MHKWTFKCRQGQELSAGLAAFAAMTCLSKSHSTYSCLRLQLEGVGTSCNVTLTAPRHMKAPVYLYYELENYYQNHRRYVAVCASLGHLISQYIAKAALVLYHKTTINKYMALVARALLKVSRKCCFSCVAYAAVATQEYQRCAHFCCTALHGFNTSFSALVACRVHAPNLHRLSVISRAIGKM